MAPSRGNSSNSARGSSGTSALSQLTNAFMGSLHLQSKSKSSRSIKQAKAKVHADNRQLSSRRSHRTSGRNVDSDALANNVDPVRAKRVSVADAVAIELANAALIDTDVQGIPRRPTMLGAARSGESFSGSIRNLKAKLLGDSSSDKDMLRNRDNKEVKFDTIDGKPTGSDDNSNDDLFLDEGDEFDDEEEDDLQMQRMRALAAAEQDELAYFSQRGASLDFKVGRRWVLHPYGRLRSAWDCFMLGLITWMLVTTPFELTFRELSQTTRRMILSVDYFLDVMFAADIIINFLTAVEYDGRLHFSYASIRRHYLAGWFLMDALWTFPFYALTRTTGADLPDFMSIADLFKSNLYPLLRIFRLARIVSLARVRRRLEFSLRISSTSSSLGGFVYSVLALSHLFSCMFAYLAFGDEYHLNLALTEHNLEDDSIYSRYVASSYWAMMTIATVGYGDLTVKSNAGRLFSITAMVIGGGIFAYGISNVVDLIQQLYIEETEHRQKMDQVNTFMHDRALPRKLRDEIRANFFHLRKATRENKAEDRAIVLQMSRTMQFHVADRFCLDMMPTKMPTLAGCNAEFIHDLYLAMEVQCYLPGEDIIRQDEFGSEMYFLFVGHVQVFVAHTRVALFGPNTCFGEFAIMNPKRPRLATIQALDFCETHCISRAQLLSIVLKHPFVVRSIRQLVQLRQRKALAILTDQTTKTRTLIQSLAVVWHTDGLQALMPPGVKVEDIPELHQFVAVERAVPAMSRLASIRMGMATTARRKSISLAAVVDPTLPAGSSGPTPSADIASTATATASLVDNLVRRRSSIRLADGPSGNGEQTTTSTATAGSTTTKLRRAPLRAGDSSHDGTSRISLTTGDDRAGLLLHQMNLLLKRQEKLEQQLQQLIGKRQSRGSVHMSFPSAQAAPVSEGLRMRTSITDLAKVSATQESPV